MFEDLIEKLKASVEELRKKLPGGGASDDDEDEYEDDEEYEEKYHGDDEDDDEGKTVKVQIKDLLKEGDDTASTGEKTQKIYSEEGEEDFDDEEDDDDADAAAKKRKKFILYGAILALLGVFLLDPQTEEKQPAPVKVVKKKKRARKKPKKKPVAPVAVEKPVEKVDPAILGDPPKVVDIPPETPAEVIKPTEPEIVPAEPIDPVEPTVEVTPTPTPEAVIADPTPTPPVDEVPMGETDDATQVDSGMDVNIGEETNTVKDPDKKSMASMIETKTEYISPPNYERSGRGLVYNCVEKHWACVDKFSYLTCRENSKWSGENSKNPECVTKNVYATIDDCVTIQKHYIEKSEPTDFCSDQKTEEVDAGDELKLLE